MKTKLERIKNHARAKLKSTFSIILLQSLIFSACGDETAVKEQNPEVHTTQDSKHYPSGQENLINPFNDIQESEESITQDSFSDAVLVPYSTFSIDVDTASYSLTRKMIMDQNTLPDKQHIRAEEYINYFNYSYQEPVGDSVFATGFEMADSPWNASKKLMRISIKAKEVATEQRPAANLVFLVDTSGSMQSPEKFPMLRDALKFMSGQMQATDKVSIVTYAGSSKIALENAVGNDTSLIDSVLSDLRVGGGTAGAKGIETAYEIASKFEIENGINRVILATDGDFNVGPSSDEELVRIIEEKAKTGIELSILGFGVANFQDTKMEKISNHGNGNYAFIDKLDEAKKALGADLNGTLYTVAKDTKLQVEFNPKKVKSFRLIGYDNRRLKDEDFNNDEVDAGDLGAGHRVTAFYELELTETAPELTETKLPEGVDSLRYRNGTEYTEASDSDEVLSLKIRFKAPGSEESQLFESQAQLQDQRFDAASVDFRFAASVVGFASKLTKSESTLEVSYDTIHSWAEGAIGNDLDGKRQEFLTILKKAKNL